MRTVIFGPAALSIEDIAALARREARAVLCDDGEFVERIESGSRFLDRMISEKGEIYGVTTGYGDSCDKKVPRERCGELPISLSRFHGCGLGDYFSPEQTRAIVAVRLASLCAGFSGVSYRLLKDLLGLLEHDILPLIPQEGSVGASGDLTPLSYVVAAIVGEREVLYRGERMGAAEALAAAGQARHELRPKEAIAIMNGTAAMTGVACLAYEEAEYLGRLASTLTAMTSIAVLGNAYHFDERLFAVKPHPGQTKSADIVRKGLGGCDAAGTVPRRLQDPYSIRCAPHVIGVLFDALLLFRGMIEIEINSANDNPVVDPLTESIWHGGHFYGGHVCFAMDGIKTAVANVADLLDRQLAFLVDEKFNRGLPPNLSGSHGVYALSHGFKAVQIGASAWTAEALKLTMPASAFSRSTECHNQDKVSMGTIAARDCVRALELARQVAAALLLADAQAIRLRLQSGEVEGAAVSGVRAIYEEAAASFPPLVDDRPMEAELRAAVERIRVRGWSLA
jgi:histidine ammonia-lyase